MNRPCAPPLSRNTRGVALIEMALMLPILTMLLFSIVSGGTWLALAHAVQQGANEGARAAMVGLTMVERAGLARDIAQSVLTRSYGVDPADIAVTVQDDGRRLMVDVAYDGSRNPLLALPFVPVTTRRIERRSAIMLTGL